MLNRKNFYIIIILIGGVAVALVIYNVSLRLNIISQERLFQEQPSDEQVQLEGVIEQKEEEPESGNQKDNSPLGEEEKNSSGNKGQNNGLIICRDDCGNGVCQEIVCTDNMNCPCAETSENCPQDCKE